MLALSGSRMKDSAAACKFDVKRGTRVLLLQRANHGGPLIRPSGTFSRGEKARLLLLLPAGEGGRRPDEGPRADCATAAGRCRPCRLETDQHLQFVIRR